MNRSISFKNSTRLFALTSVAALGVFGASNSSAAASIANATATVIVPIKISKTQDLNFGKFAPGAGGSLMVSTDGTRTASGVIMSSNDSSPTAAQFDVVGDSNATYGITWSGDAELTGTESSDSIALTRISDFDASGTTSGAVSSGKLNAGEQTIYLGGVLTIGEAQAIGAYAGNITATVEYN
jgi:hypothetical protein